jgi:4-hydroxybenzoate polyprenyltransferase
MNTGRAPEQDDSDRRRLTHVYNEDELDKPAGDAATKESTLRLWIREIRVHQWLKNLLIFVPLLASHRIGKPGALADGLIAFSLFSCCASSAYILNDLLDLSHDRLHPYRSRRPFASGRLNVRTGLWVFPLLLLVAFASAYWLLPWKFTVALAGYYLVTTAYSLFLKRFIVIDVVTLAMLYTLRIIAGALVFHLVLTFWMLAFSMFIFLSLALAKRYTELFGARNRGDVEQAHGRGYYLQDLGMISSFGAASGYISVMVLALYIQDQNTMVLYRHPQLIWLACPLLLFWISRVWMLTHRGEMYDDPVVFAVRDPTSMIVGALFGLVFWLAA